MYSFISFPIAKIYKKTFCKQKKLNQCMNWPMKNDVTLAFHVQFKPNIGNGFTLPISFIFTITKNSTWYPIPLNRPCFLMFRL